MLARKFTRSKLNRLPIGERAASEMNRRKKSISVVRVLTNSTSPNKICLTIRSFNNRTALYIIMGFPIIFLYKKSNLSIINKHHIMLNYFSII